MGGRYGSNMLERGGLFRYVHNNNFCIHALDLIVTSLYTQFQLTYPITGLKIRDSQTRASSSFAHSFFIMVHYVVRLRYLSS